MFINFGELLQPIVTKLCGFMRVFNFPPNFFNELDSYYDVVMEFYSKDEVVVTIDGKECYHGDFDEAWNNHEYYLFFNELISELREERDDRVSQSPDQLDNLVREVDYLDLFTDYLDEMSEQEDSEEEQEEDPMVDDLESDTKTIHL
jgi:hypothetical protein